MGVRQGHRAADEGAVKALVTGAAGFIGSRLSAALDASVATYDLLEGLDVRGMTTTDADVVAFIDRMLADWYAAEERDRFLAGLAELDARCRARRGRDFADCDAADQRIVLSAFDDEVTALRRTRGSSPNDHWFAMLKYLTAFGYCTSEVAMRRTLGDWPRPTRYDGCAPVPLTRSRAG